MRPVEGVFVLLVLAALALPVTVILLVVWHFSQQRRVEELATALIALQAQVRALTQAAQAEAPPPEAPPAQVVTETPEAPAPAVPPVLEPATPPAPPPMPLKIAAETASAARMTGAPPPPVPSARPAAPVRDALARLGPWLQENWFYAVSAVSLALAGIFLVQYGMENGLLPPRARVAGAIGFGALLVAAGEWIRRRYGDGTESVTAYLPSVFSGAGIVTLFGAVLSARMLYGLIGGNAAMLGMVAVALLALVLGWLHGPLLVAVGVVGAYAAPVVLDSSDTDASPLYVYFAIIAMLGLGVDTIRRWGWISALTLVLAYLAGWGLLLSRGDELVWAAIAYFTLLAVIAVLIPARGLVPDHEGPTLSEAVFRIGAGRFGDAGSSAAFPTLMAFAAVAVTSLSLACMAFTPEAELWLSMVCLAGLAYGLILGSRPARALQDVALLPAAALLVSVWVQGTAASASYRAFSRTYEGNPEAAFPWGVTALVVAGAILSLAAAWRSLQGGRLRLLWAAVATVYAPAMAILLEVSWDPSAVIGAYPWALHAAALAALMVLLAERFARADGEARLRTSFAVISALSCLVFAFVIVLSASALTVALAATVVAAAALDRRWDLPPLSLYVMAGVAVLGWRLIADPGLEAGRYGPLGGMLLAYGGTLAALVAALVLLSGRDRPMARVILDSAAWSTGGTLLSLMLFRWIDGVAPGGSDGSHWALGLTATIWLGLALAQVQRLVPEGPLRQVRLGLTAVFGVIGLGALLLAFGDANPLFDWDPSGRVLGPPLFNTLAAAYLLPALVLLAGAWRLREAGPVLRAGLAAVGLVVLAVWVVLAIRHVWQGGAAMHVSHGMGQPELYSYTVALLLLGAGLFYRSLARGGALLRRAGLVVIGLVVAKVFLVDIAGLGGLTRVFSLLLLGLSLAGLAWLNRWAQARDAQAAGGDGGLPQ